jgi:ribosomal protein S8
MEESMSKLIQEVLKQLQQEGYTEKGIKKHSQTYSLLMSYADQIGQHEYSEEFGQTLPKSIYRWGKRLFKKNFSIRRWKCGLRSFLKISSPIRMFSAA